MGSYDKIVSQDFFNRMCKVDYDGILAIFPYV